MKTMEKMINTIATQANELLKSDVIVNMLAECKTEEERCAKLAIASMYSLCKAN